MAKFVYRMQNVLNIKMKLETQAKLAAAYGVRRHGRLYRRLLVAWAMMWVEIFDWLHYFKTWNREG